jgi:pyridoxamine 5'-phosphate oxidase
MPDPRFAELRENYTKGGLLEADLATDPFTQFHRWFEEALAAQIQEANAMTIATVDAAGNPDARIVLLKSLDDRGFVFFTNYESAKGSHLAAKPHAALCFYWKELERQVRARGPVEPVSREESATYFALRPRASQIGAWVSRQSSVIAGRETLDAARERYEREFGDGEIPVPPFWGGYVLRPESLEFWQGRPGRLHDRLRYHRGENLAWQIERLAP